ncbi:hypothetical protein KDI_47620 [Dictyobacter arantiisoli]|uniref:Uncharacterized protein n=1 Tax=Dictyobacter arantiisoli TaxID=2014874 RepID=A0A5A5TJ07_9CHLR|nr:hypothetical protein KDI_47620 [Dictyobacter arantiisoli]
MPNGSIPALVMCRLWNLKPPGSGIAYDPFERGLVFGVHSKSFYTEKRGWDGVLPILPSG